MDSEAAQSIAVVLAAVVAVSLTLSQVLGGLLVYLTEAIKATGKVRDGWAGVVSLILGVLLGVALAGLADMMSPENTYSLGAMLLLGAFAGALMAAGAVKTYKAMGDVNPQASSGLLTVTPLEVSVEDIEPALNEQLLAQYREMNETLESSFKPRPEGAPETMAAPV